MQRTDKVEPLLNQRFVIYLIAISTLLPLSGRKILAMEVIGATNSIPTVTYTNGEQQLVAPDWSK